MFSPSFLAAQEQSEEKSIDELLDMSLEDILQFFDVEGKQLDQTLMSLESKGLVKLYRDKKGIALAKATYDGLNQAFPLEHYRWYPSWVTKENIF